MNKRLIMVEGLPGSGKTTTSSLVQKILLEKGVESNLFLEGDINHPADFESVACLNESEYKEIGVIDESLVQKVGNDYLIPYRKLTDASDELLGFLSKRDVYEMPFEKNRALIVGNWGRFAETAEGINVFECCFIQNPVTAGMIKYGVSDDEVISYVEYLAEKVKDLNPVLIYVDQDDIETSFTKAFEERPKEWSDFFIDYYTSQGFGKKNGLKGFQGTIEVLKARKELEKKIIARLDFPKVIINNSKYDLEEVTRELKQVL